MPPPARRRMQPGRAREQRSAAGQGAAGAAPTPATQPRGHRRALSNPRGAISCEGEEHAARQLAAALEAAGQDADRFTHGFHSYSARMHPSIARAAIEALSRPGERVLDPFCGSGTVLVEAMLAARTAVGVDLSPLALRIAAVHSELRSETERQRFLRVLEHVASASLARVRARTRARAPLSAQARALYDPHVLLELAGLLDEIGAVQPEADRLALEMVFSALLVKFSHQRADSSQETVPKRIRKGLCSEFFLRKGRELVQRWAELRQAVAPGAVAPRLRAGDARELPELLAEQQRFDLVLSSPPYGGTYDYHAQHALRCAWLGLDAHALERAELGARRRLSRSEDAAARWDGELQACLRAMAAVCKPKARIALLLGDAQVGGMRIDASAQLARLAQAAGLEWIAAAAQARTDFQGGPARNEHLILLRRFSAERA